jgi:glycine betaine catabolism B
MLCTLVKKKTLSKNAIEIILKPQGDFEFEAGQYVEIINTNINNDPIGNTRDFSIASSPNEKNISFILRIHAHMYPFKKYLVNSSIGLMIDISEPKGSFVLPKNTDKKVVFIAGGIGITPFLSMIFFAHEKKLPYNIHLLYFSKCVEDGIYIDELRELGVKNKLFKISDFYGMLGDDTLKETLPLDSGTLYYIAGPPGMVTQALESLKKLGIPEDQTKTEEFKGYN